MATRANTCNTQPNQVLVFTWTGILNGDDGDPIETPWLSDKTVHFKGTFGASGSISLEGSNDKLTWQILHDPTVTAAITATVEKLAQVLENPLWVRPHCTAGDGTTSLTCIIVCKAATRFI